MAEDKSRHKAVPRGRVSRLTGMAKLASGVAGGMLAEGTRRLRQGQRPTLQEMLLTPANARRVTDELARLRGAAMKVGQLLSMDAGDVLPPELADILARLRADAHYMPVKQLVQVLVANYGPDWEERFYRFEMKPVAAASIGQVHDVISARGKRLALKVQYPGVAQSIDSDVDNVATLLRMTGLLPAGFDLKTILAEAKQQLHREADYLREAGYLRQYGKWLAGSEQFMVPEVDDELTTASILAMSFMPGEPIEHLERESQAVRDRVVAELLQLLFREIFELRLVQTDPNFANYRYEPRSARLVLLDFGACREYSARFSRGYRAFFTAAVNGDRKALQKAAHGIGYFSESISPQQVEVVLDVFWLATEPMRRVGPYDFAGNDLLPRIREAALQMSLDKGLWHTPPTEALLLHRKLGGLLMLATRLRARVDVHRLLLPFL